MRAFFDTDAHEALIGRLKLRRLERFTYEYDFGDEWVHDLRIEATLPLDPKAQPTSQGVIAAWLAKPRIFEIGRTGAFDFAGRPHVVLSASNKIANIRTADWTDSVDIHPEGTPLYPSPGKVIMFLLFSVMPLAIWVPFFALDLEFRRPALRARVEHLDKPRARKGARDGRCYSSCSSSVYRFGWPSNGPMWPGGSPRTESR
jgi:hypothetical protein